MFQKGDLVRWNEFYGDVPIVRDTGIGVVINSQKYDYFGDECRWEQEIDGEVKLKIIRREDEKADLLDTILALIEITENTFLSDTSYQLKPGLVYNVDSNPTPVRVDGPLLSAEAAGNFVEDYEYINRWWN